MKDIRSSCFLPALLRLLSRHVAIVFLAFCITMPLLSQTEGNSREPGFSHDYSQTLVMKMLLSIPDGKGGTNVYCDLDRALDIIRQTDNLTLGVPKIIYMVGWQYRGHDDLYPAMFGVNPALKREGDPDARESFRRFMREARQYNTTISLHINMTDAYDNSPLWQEYVDNDLISKNADGSLMVIGNYNNLKAYQINYRNEWEKGYARMRVDRLLELLPELKEAGTIHVDAWIARDNKGAMETNIMESKYQEKVCGYWRSKGIDVSSEWVMDYMTGLVPHYWHLNHRTQDDYLKIPANVLTGTHMNPDLKNSDFGLEFLFGTSVYGEGLFPNGRNRTTDENWDAYFTRDFCLNFLQYHYLNSQSRIRVEGTGNSRVAFFSGDIVVSLADSTVKEGGTVLRKGSDIFFPATWRKDNSMVAYSVSVGKMEQPVPHSWGKTRFVTVNKITKEGLVKTGRIKLKDGKIRFDLEPGKAMLLTPEE